MLAYLDAVRRDRPALLWPLTEGAGTTARDASGNGRDGTIHGAPQLRGGTALPGAPAVQFGAGQYVHANASLTLGSSFTLECWLYKTAHLSGYPGDINSVIGDLFSGGNGALIRYDGPPTLRFYFATGGGYAVITVPSARLPALRHPMHLVASARPGRQFLQVNGTVVAEATAGSISGFSGAMRVARSEAGRNIGGAIGFAAAYNAALGPADGARHYAAGLAHLASRRRLR